LPPSQLWGGYKEYEAEWKANKAAIQPGNSGGPVLDQGGNLVGVTAGKLDAIKFLEAIKDVAQNVNFAIKTAILVNFLDANGVKYAMASDPPHRSDPG
jgi:S1-C subfamily serine protease